MSQWNEVQRTTRLRGQFYEGKHERLFPTETLDLAMDGRRWQQLQQQQRRAQAMGVDVAAGGRDQSSWTVIDQFGIIEQIVKDTPHTMEIAGLTRQLIEQYQLPAWHVAFDAGGGGKQIADRLEEQGFAVIVVHFGEAADARQAYVNRRAELYGVLAACFDPEREEGVFCLPPEGDELRAELNVLPLRYDSEGRLVLPPKQPGRSGPTTEKSIRQLLGRSPDRADSLALATWILHRNRRVQDYSDVVLFAEYDDVRPDEYDQLPDEFRELFEMYDERARDHGTAWGDDRYDDWL